MPLHTHDEGIIRGLPANMFVDGHLLFGTVVLAGHDGRGNLVDLTDEQVERWMARLS